MPGGQMDRLSAQTDYVRLKSDVGEPVKAGIDDEPLGTRGAVMARPV